MNVFNTSTPILGERVCPVDRAAPDRSNSSEVLHAPLVIERSLGPLSVLGPKVGPLIFEFSQFYAGEFATRAPFIDALAQFFSAIAKVRSYACRINEENRKRSPCFTESRIGLELLHPKNPEAFEL